MNTSLCLCIRVVCLLMVISLCSAESSADDLAQIQCVMASASVNFGKINLKQNSYISSEGELVVSCQNLSTTVRREKLTLSFPTMGSQSMLIRSATGVLPVMFYHDAQFSEQWGDDRNGASALQVMLELAPREKRRIRFPVYVLLQNRRDTTVGIYHSTVPVVLTTEPFLAL